MDFNTLKYQFGRFLLPVLFLIGGIYLMKLALVPTLVTLRDGTPVEVTQSDVFLYASLFFVLGSVIWLLYLSGLIKKFIGWSVMGIMFVAAAYILFTNYSEVKTTIDDIQAYELRDTEIKQRMSDIKLAQQAYKEANGLYTKDMDALIDFVKNGKKMVIKKIGAVPERKITPEERDYLYNDNRPIDNLMTEREAALLAISPFAENDADLKGFVRDTTYVPVWDAVFKDAIYLEKREKLEISEFNPDSLKYIPFTTEPVKIDTSSVLRNEIRVPTLEFEMYHPMDTSVHYVVGDIDDNNLRESWIKG